MLTCESESRGYPRLIMNCRSYLNYSLSRYDNFASDKNSCGLYRCNRLPRNTINYLDRSARTTLLFVLLGHQVKILHEVLAGLRRTAPIYFVAWHNIITLSTPDFSRRGLVMLLIEHLNHDRSLSTIVLSSTFPAVDETTGRRSEYAQKVN